MRAGDTIATLADLDPGTRRPVQAPESLAQRLLPRKSGASRVRRVTPFSPAQCEGNSSGSPPKLKRQSTRILASLAAQTESSKLELVCVDIGKVT
jgi:hypothetical protein